METCFKKIIFTVLSLIILNVTLIGKDDEEHAEGGPTLTLNNETSFTLNFPFSFKPEYKTWADLKKVFTAARSISDLPPNGIHTENFDTLKYGQKGTTFEVLSAEWPKDKRLTVHIPKKPGEPIFTPFLDEENEIYGETLGIDYNLEWSDDEPNVGWVITFFEEGIPTAKPKKSPSPQVQALRERKKKHK